MLTEGAGLAGILKYTVSCGVFGSFCDLFGRSRSVSRFSRSSRRKPHAYTDLWIRGLT